MRRNLSTATLLALMALGHAVPALAQRETVIPQIADGPGIVRTKLDIRNLGSTEAITRLKIYFYRQDGSAWNVATNLGTASEFLINVGRTQVLRIETLALAGGLTSGYAVLRNSEGNARSVPEFQTSVSVYYEVLEGPRILDTVSVPASPPTLRWSFPVEGDAARQLYSGFAIVNLSDSPNRVTLRLWNAFPPFGSDASDGGTVTLTLGAREQRARFLGEPGLFNDRTVFKGSLVGSAEKPVAVVGLLQTAAATGVQYATLAPEYLDALQNESSLYLPDGAQLDADALRVPYVSAGDDGSFDLLYQFVSSTVRNFVPQNGASFALLGRLSAGEFNTLTVEDLQSRSYSATSIDLSDFTGTLGAGLSIAIKTSVGRYAKLRVASVGPGPVRDLAAQVYVYR
jgi:hypothetical protein